MARQQIRTSEIALTDEQQNDCGGLFFIQVRHGKQWLALGVPFADVEARNSKFKELLAQPNFKR